MNDSAPEISVITIFRNQQADLSDTLHSLLVQTFKNFECILVDGNSTDSSADQVHQLTGREKNFTMICQESEGISNAFNEGLRMARGNYVLFLNGGDILSGPDSLMKAADKIREHPGRIISFRTEYMAESGKPLGRFIPPERPDFAALDWYCSLAHQSTFIPLGFFRKNGGYLPVLKVAMDYEVWLRARKMGYKLESFPDVTARHRIGGVSFLQVNQGRKELILSRLLHLGAFRKSILKDAAQGMLILMSTILRLLQKYRAA